MKKKAYQLPDSRIPQYKKILIGQVARKAFRVIDVSNITSVESALIQKSIHTVAKNYIVNNVKSRAAVIRNRPTIVAATIKAISPIAEKYGATVLSYIPKPPIKPKPPKQIHNATFKIVVKKSER